MNREVPNVLNICGKLSLLELRTIARKLQVAAEYLPSSEAQVTGAVFIPSETDERSFSQVAYKFPHERRLDHP
jgi:hypothetical protein